MKKPVVFGIGEIVWDCLPDGEKLGGAPVNFCYYAGKAGAVTFPVSAIGEDVLGKRTLESCAAFGLDTRFIQRNVLSTSRVLVEKDAAGVPRYNILENVAWDALEAPADVLGALAGADALCWGSLAGRSEPSFLAIRRMLASVPERCFKVYDINIRQHYFTREKIADSLRLADILKVSDEEFPVLQDLFGLPEEPVRAIDRLQRDYSLRMVIYTGGAKFSEIYTPEGLHSHLPTPKVNVADTVGAGDSFTATFITSLLLGHSITEAHRKAVEIAARVCACPGAIVPLD